jgi:LDH2 family malate/lactate/ureidoglycolate dehydrogenase
MDTQTKPDRVHLDVAAAHHLGEAALRGVGYEAEEARIITDHVVDAALCGYEYSGMTKLLNVAEGYTSTRTSPKVIRDKGLAALMDGGNNTGMLSVYRGTEEAIRRANQHGMSIVIVNRSWVSGRSAYYMEMMANAGLVGLHVAAGAGGKVAPHGGARAAMSTNPIAFGFPTEGEPFIVDMGTSAMMGTDLQYRNRVGLPLAEGVALDRHGKPTTDAAAVLDGGVILPFGGHKGFGLGLAFHALCLLAGDGHTSKVKGFANGYVLIAIKPDLFMPLEDYRARVSEEIARIKQTETLPGFAEIRIPNERSARERRENLVKGLVIDRLVYDKLVAMAA